MSYLAEHKLVNSIITKKKWCGIRTDPRIRIGTNPTCIITVFYFKSQPIIEYTTK